MRTAEQMAQHCATREELTNFEKIYAKKQLKLIENLLENDEDVKNCFSVTAITDDRITDDMSLALSNLHLYTAQHTMFNSKVNTYNIEDIVEAKLLKSGILYNTYVIVLKNSQIKFKIPKSIDYQMDFVDIFNNALKDLQQASKEKTGSCTSIDISDEILKLKRLLDDGIITEQEFEQLKKKIINKI